MKKHIIIFLSLFLSIFAFSNSLHSDYQVNNDKVYLINPAFFDECYIAIRENLMPDWYRKEIGLSKVRLALTDTLDNGTPIGRAMAKRAAQSIVEKIVNAIAQESNTATSDNS